MRRGTQPPVKALCATRPADWWDPGDDGNRLALALCRVCPWLQECADGEPRPFGVIRAGVAYSDSGLPLPICDCGYPNVGFRGGGLTRCRWCAVPSVRVWSRRRYWQMYYRNKRMVSA